MVDKQNNLGRDEILGKDVSLLSEDVQGISADF